MKSESKNRSIAANGTGFLCTISLLLCLVSYARAQQSEFEYVKPEPSEFELVEVVEVKPRVIDVSDGADKVDVVLKAKDYLNRIGSVKARFESPSKCYKPQSEPSDSPIDIENGIETHKLTIEIPQNAEPGDWTLLITIGDGEGTVRRFHWNGTIKVKVREAPNRFNANLKIGSIGLDDPSGNNALDAGETVNIVFELTNEGRGRAEDVRINLNLKLLEIVEASSNHLGYDNDPQCIGPIEAGDTRTVYCPVEADHEIADGEVTFQFVARERSDFGSDSFSINFRTISFHPPEFVVDKQYVMIDDDTEGDSYGNGNGQIERKERIEVTVALQNMQRWGDAQGVTATVSIKGKDIFYKSSSNRFSLGSIKAGDYKDLTFAFVTNNNYEGDDVPIVVKVTESNSPAKYLELKLPIDKPIARVGTVPVPIIPVTEPTTVLPIVPIPPSVIPENVIPQFGKNAVAIIFGIEEYLNIGKTDYVKNDAEKFFEYANKVLGIPTGRILSVSNREATKLAFDEKISEWFKQCIKAEKMIAQDTEIFFFYAGHGAIFEKEPHLVPYDASFDLKIGLIRLMGLYGTLNALGAKHVTVFIDACFSGTARPLIKKDNTTGQISMLNRRSRSLDLEIKTPDAYPKFTVMTSSSGVQESYSDEKLQQGVFTHYLLRGLQGNANSNGDDQLTVSELETYLKRRVPDHVTATYGNRRQQRPDIKSSDPNRVLVKLKQEEE